MELALPFIRLPLSFDFERLGEEIASLDESAWMPHPSGMEGNSAVALISREGGDNDHFGGRMKATSHLANCEYHQQVMASFGEVLARSRLMKLDAGSKVSIHVDFNYHWYSRVRIHIPVITNPDVIFYCDNEQVHMKAGECWIFDNWRRHRVLNESKHDRIHLVIDLAGSSRFWRMAREMQEMDTSDNNPAFTSQLRHLEYEPGKTVNIETEKYNISPVMVPGEVDYLVASVISEIDANPDNDAQLAKSYRVMLQDFASDWRETWHRHGIQAEGIPHYQQLIERATRSLHPNRRALVTASNDIGINPIIMQRILRPALATEMQEQFVQGVDGKAG